MRMVNVRLIYIMLLMMSVAPYMLLLVASSWFMYVGGLPDMITLKLDTKATFYITSVAIIATWINFGIAMNLTDRCNKE